MAREPTANPAVLHVSLLAGEDRTGTSDPDPWLNEDWILNITGLSGTFTLRIEDVSGHIWSNDTRLVVALNDAAYNNLVELTVDNITIVKDDFEFGALKPYDLKEWPSGDVYPSWFNDTLVNVGMIPPKGQVHVDVSAEFSSPTGVRMHFDAYGSGLSPDSPAEKGYITRNPLSEDSTVLFCGPSPTPPPPPQLHLPSAPVTMTVVDGSTSYFLITLSNVPAGFDVPNGEYLGWCLDGGHNMSRGVPLAVTLYSTLNPPESLSVKPWNEINYILNHKQGTMGDVQQAILYLMGWGNFANLSPTAQALVNEANAHPDFVPSVGQIIGILCYPADPNQQLSLIEVTIALPTPPVARFSWSPISPQVGDLATFNGSLSTPDGGTIVSYEWNFGDDSPSVFGETVYHTYSTYGIYTVTLNVTDSEGKWDIESQNITVRAHPHADFTWSPLSPQVNETVTFDASPSTPDGGTIIGYEWDFGDGRFGTGKIVIYAYTIAGTYTVTLNVTDSEGKWDTESKQITVKPRTPPPQPPAVGGYAAPIDIAGKQSLQLSYQMGLAVALIAVVTAILLARRKGKMLKRAP